MFDLFEFILWSSTRSSGDFDRDLFSGLMCFLSCL